MTVRRVVRHNEEHEREQCKPWEVSILARDRGKPGLATMARLAVYFSFVKSNTKYHISLIRRPENCGTIATNEVDRMARQRGSGSFPKTRVRTVQSAPFKTGIRTMLRNDRFS